MDTMRYVLVVGLLLAASSEAKLGRRGGPAAAAAGALRPGHDARFAKTRQGEKFGGFFDKVKEIIPPSVTNVVKDPVSALKDPAKLVDAVSHGIALGKDVVEGAKCLVRAPSKVEKDLDPLGWPAAPKKCTDSEALETARRLVKTRDPSTGKFGCVDGKFETDSPCMLQALGEADRKLKVSGGQTIMMHDLYGGFLTVNMFDRHVLKGLGKCMSRFPTEVPGMDMWAALKKGYGDMVKFWTPGFYSPELKAKIKAQNYKSCNALNGPYCMDVEAPGSVWDNATAMAQKLKEMEEGLSAGGFAPEKMLASTPTFGTKWMENNPVSVGEMRRRGQFDDDHPLKYVDDNIQFIQPCNVLGALAYSEIAVSACDLAPKAKSGPKFEFIRDTASIFSMLSWGNMVYHGSKRMGSTDVYPMNGMFHKMYEFTIDNLMTFPDTPRGRKDRHIVRDLPFLRNGCEMDMETCEDSSKYIRAFENLVAKDKSPKTWRMFGSGKISGVNKMDQPPYDMVAALMIIVRLQAIFHAKRIAFGDKIWEMFYNMLGKYFPAGKEAVRAIAEDYAPALGRAQMKCFKKGKHKCLDSLLMSKFDEWFSTLIQFPIALWFQEERIGMNHFSELQGAWKLPQTATDCSQMPHAMWHRKSAQFLDALVRQTYELPDLLTDQCADVGDNLGNGWGVGSIVDLFTSTNFKRSMGTMLGIRGLGDKLPASFGIPMVDAAIAKLKAHINKDVGSTDINGIWAVVNAAKQVLHQDGRCDVEYSSAMGPDVTATSTCDCKQAPKPLFVANPPAVDKDDKGDSEDSKGNKIAWQTVWSQGEEVNQDVGEEKFNAMLDAAPNKIVRRICEWCLYTHKEIYYKRLTPLKGFNAYHALGHTWTAKGNPEGSNAFNKDFKLYSTYQDAVKDEHAWTRCNFDSTGTGFPRDCGPNSFTMRNWYSMMGPLVRKQKYLVGDGVIFQMETLKDGAPPVKNGMDDNAKPDDSLNNADEEKKPDGDNDDKEDDGKNDDGEGGPIVKPKPVPKPVIMDGKRPIRPRPVVMDGVRPPRPPMPKLCCRALTAKCMACSQGIKVEDFCAKVKNMFRGCPGNPLAGDGDGDEEVGGDGEDGQGDNAGYEPCAKKEDGARCSLCKPGAKDCFETKVVKTCQHGKCRPGWPSPPKPPVLPDFDGTGKVGEQLGKILRGEQLLDQMDDKLQEHEEDIEEGSKPGMDRYRAMLRSDQKTETKLSAQTAKAKAAVEKATKELADAEKRQVDQDKEVDVAEKEYVAGAKAMKQDNGQMSEYALNQKALVGAVRQQLDFANK
eukprot:g4238.t1